MPCFKDTASITNIDAKVPALMPQGLVPVIISLLRLAAAAHEGTKDCPHSLLALRLNYGTRDHCA